MNRYKAYFQEIQGKEGRFAFCPFAVVGFPTIQKSFQIVRDYLDGKGVVKRFGKADLLELGLPFSDPVADGPIIQKASNQALQNGFRMRKLFPFIKRVRKLTDIPIGILSYANPIFQYGIEKFYKKLKLAGADSILIVDLSVEEIDPFLQASRKTGLAQVFIVTDKTVQNISRVKQILKHSKAYIYVVSRSDVTGVKKDIPSSLKILVKKLKSLTKIPLLVGFGVSHKSQIQKLRKLGVDGYIIGSSFIKDSFRYTTITSHG